MSLIQTFLRGGTPSHSLEDWKKFSTQYSRWRWAVVFPRFWSLDIRKNALSSPVVHMLFGTNNSSSASEEDDLSSWHLLLIHANHHSVDTLKQGMHIVMNSYLKETPVGLLPHQIDVVAVVNGSTHEKINLFSKELWKASCSFIEGSLRETWATKTVKTIYCIEDGKLTMGNTKNFPAPELFASLAWNVVNWVREKKFFFEEMRDASLPDIPPTSSLMDVLFRINPLLYRGVFVSQNTHVSSINKRDLSLHPPNEVKNSSNSFEPLSNTNEKVSNELIQKTTANKEAALLALNKRVGECTTFSFSFPNASSSSSFSFSGKMYHALLWQKPIVEKVPLEHTDNLDPGPLSPQPLSAELHIYTDPGEPLYLQQCMRDVAYTLDFSFDDILHEEGELLVQLSPVEGVPFDVLDRFLESLEHKVTVLKCSTTAKTSEESTDQKTPSSNHSSDEGRQFSQPDVLSSAPFLKDSCSGFVFPRVIRRIPTGSTTKLNPMTRTRAEVKVLPPTEEEIEVAAVAILTVSQHVQLVSATAKESDEEKSQQKDTTLEQLRASFSSPSSFKVPPRYVLNSDSLPEIFFSPTFISLRSFASNTSFTPSSMSALSCEWCQRQREKLLQCSGCKMAFYCGKRHQAMDWKERQHKMECKWWKTAWEQMRDNLLPFTTQQLTTEPWRQDSLAFSYASTVFSFLQTVVKEWEQGSSDDTVASSKVLPEKNGKKFFTVYILLRDLTLPGCASSTTNENGVTTPFAERFLKALRQKYAREFSLWNRTSVDETSPTSTFTMTSKTSSLGTTKVTNTPLQVRCVLLCNNFSDSERNDVWSLQRESGEVLLRFPTGILGDIWREGEISQSDDSLAFSLASANSDSSMPLFLCRVTNSSLHDLLSINPSIDVKSKSIPDAMLSFGPCNGNGLSYLTSSVEVAANQLIGRVPTQWIESSYVGCLRTQRAVFQRITNSLVTQSRVKEYIRGHFETSEMLPVKANYSGVLCGLHFVKHEKRGERNPSGTEKSDIEVPIFPNAYAFNFPALL